MIIERTGNILLIPQGIIVHGCNCQGVMGGGIAREVRERFPSAYEVYRDKYTSLQTEPGGPYCGLQLGEITYSEVDGDKYIINANTQDNFGTHRRQVSYDAVVSCFEKVEELARQIEANTGKKLEICFPLIGAGLGGGNWKIISTAIDETVSDDFTKVVYHFQPAPPVDRLSLK